jgi:hypothetical protein
MSEGKSFDTSGLRYSFGKIHGEERWQVRLKGEFVCFTTVKSAAIVDQELQKHGYTSRQEVLDELIQTSLSSL